MSVVENAKIEEHLLRNSSSNSNITKDCHFTMPVDDVEGNGNECDKASDVTAIVKRMAESERVVDEINDDNDDDDDDDEGSDEGDDDKGDDDDEDFTEFQQSPPTQNERANEQQPQQLDHTMTTTSEQLEVNTPLASNDFDVRYTPTPPSASASESIDTEGNNQLLEYEVESMQPLSERWSPVGANYDDAITPNSELSPELELELLNAEALSDKHQQQQLALALATSNNNNDPLEMARLRTIEEEQELLTSSLMSLTSHFAHVQLRVRQIVEAPSHERDQLLKDLEEFAFRGIPEPMSALTPQDDDETAQRRQFELIEHLKTQLCELEKVAYESGAPVLPQHILVEKQKIIIDELKNKLNLKVEEQDLPELSSEELKHQVDNAIGEFVGPLKMKEQLVAQLKTQITDLERFIAFLQCDSDPKMKTFNGANGEKFAEAYNSYAAKKKGASARSKKSQSSQQQAPPPPPSQQAGAATARQDVVTSAAAEPTNSIAAQAPAAAQQHVELQAGVTLGGGGGVRESLHSKAHGLMDKASLLMQMFATTHFGSRAEQFQKNSLKKTHKGNHWGDLRAQLEVDIQEVASLAATLTFDREKLAKMKLVLKKSRPVAAAAVAGPLATAPLPRTTQPQQQSNAAAVAQLQPYPISSDSDEDTYECATNWEAKARRAARHGGDSINTISKELTAAVRKNFAMTLLRLIQHGLRVEAESATSSLIVPFMRCLNPSPVFAAEHSQRAGASAASAFLGYASAAPAPYGAHNDFDDDDNGQRSGGSRQMHAWELILEYYYLKHGDEYNNTPARKLSQSFNLDIVDAQAITPKQNLLSAIGQIIAMHRPYKRSFNAHFKAFVCAGLNARQLVDWLNLIFSCNDLIDMYYTADSYVVRTGFRDSLRSIDTLSKYEFDLPVDLAVRHFRNI